MKPIKNVFITAVMLAHAWCAGAQQDSKWVFGYKCGIDFSTSPPGTFEMDMNWPMFTSASSTYYYSSKNLTIYSDGVVLMCNGIAVDTFITKNHFLLYYPGCANEINYPEFHHISGTGYSTLILEAPSQPDMFYVVYGPNSPMGSTTYNPGYKSYSAKYRINNDGSISRIYKDKRLTKTGIVFKGIKAIRHANNRDWWIVYSDPVDWRYRIRTILLSPCGFDTTLYTTFGGIELAGDFTLSQHWATGFLDFHYATNKFVMSLEKGYFLYGKFDRCSGQLYEDTVLFMNYYNEFIPYMSEVEQLQNINIGDLCLSSDGNNLYFARSVSFPSIIEVQLPSGVDTVLSAGLYCLNVSLQYEVTCTMFFDVKVHMDSLTKTRNNPLSIARGPDDKIYFVLSAYANCSYPSQTLIPDYNCVVYQISNPNAGIYDIQFDTFKVYSTPQIFRLLVTTTEYGPFASMPCNDPCYTGIQESGMHNWEINIYPNPAQNTVNIELPEAGNYRIQVYSIDGRLFMSQQVIYDDELELNTSDWQQGLYLMNINDEKSAMFIRKKLLVMH